MNSLSKTDITFFIIIASLIVAVIAFYFLAPMLNQKKYKQARADLAKREEAYYKDKGVDLGDHNSK